jgi:hypothetical protein
LYKLKADINIHFSDLDIEKNGHAFHFAGNNNDFRDNIPLLRMGLQREPKPQETDIKD